MDYKCISRMRTSFNIKKWILKKNIFYFSILRHIFFKSGILKLTGSDQTVDSRSVPRVAAFWPL